MLYINNPGTTAMTYKAVVEAVIAAGIEPQRAYIYLAGLGIKGELTRIKRKDEPGYLPPVKMAVRNNNDSIDSVQKCEHCGAIEII